MSKHTGLRLRIIDQIRAERERQIDKGYTAAHDDAVRAEDELALLASGYASQGAVYLEDGTLLYKPAAYPRPRERQLVIAGALIVAELERLHLAKRGEDADSDEAP